MRLVAATLLAAPLPGAAMAEPGELGGIVAEHIRPILPADRGGGAAVAVRRGGATSFFNFGFADRDTRRAIDADTLFNLASLRKVFETALLAQGVVRGELGLGDRASDYVVELQRGGDIRSVTLGELATHTSGLLLPQDHPPWPERGYTLPEFIDTLNAWRKPDGTAHRYTHAGFILLQLALERRHGAPIDVLLERRITQPLGLASTVLPRGAGTAHGRLPPELAGRAVQGYTPEGERFGAPGEQQGYYHWPGTGQMYSSPRDMAIFLAACLGERRVEPSLRQALVLAQRPVLRIGPRNEQAMAWEILHADPPGAGAAIVEKYGGLYNASAYIGMMPDRALGVVILGNRGNQYPHEIGRRLLRHLAGE
jgi:beta-lactamase class C